MRSMIRLMVALFVVAGGSYAVSQAASASGGNEAPLHSCSVSTIAGSSVGDGPSSFEVTWSSGDVAVDRVVVERRVFDRFHWRGRVAPGVGEFVDTPSSHGASSIDYRITAVVDGHRSEPIDCGFADSAEISCEVRSTDGRYELSVTGGSDIDAVDYVWRRSISNGGPSHWRGRTDVASLSDGPSPSGTADYRVVVRSNRRIAAVTSCDEAGYGAVEPAGDGALPYFHWTTNAGPVVTSPDGPVLDTVETSDGVVFARARTNEPQLARFEVRNIDLYRLDPASGDLIRVFGDDGQRDGVGELLTGPTGLVYFEFADEFGDSRVAVVFDPATDDAAVFGEQLALESLAVGPDGSAVASMGSSGELIFIRTAAGDTLDLWRVDGGLFTAERFLTDGRLVINGGNQAFIVDPNAGVDALIAGFAELGVTVIEL